MMVEQWTEGPAAGSEAAGERYDSDLRATRKASRDVIRADLPAAHFGLGTVVVASVIVGYFATPGVAALVAGAFAALFLAAFAVMFLRGIRSVDGWRRAYLFTFGWANWL
ncbi:hypothetical protein [Streptomyces sp. NPDC006551]|uniref:hypothetical protein n=1 Tax=Streptomyces sp. NPDC006551 TaxID=3157178 RepID=UPI0033BD14E0